MHGTGCTFSAAIAAAIARGDGLEAAVRNAKHYVTGVIRNARAIGRGRRVGDHFYFHDADDFPAGE